MENDRLNMDNVASDGEYQKEGNQNLDIKKKKKAKLNRKVQAAL